MKLVIEGFEDGHDWSNCGSILNRASTLQLMLDVAITDAKAQGLIMQGSDKDLRITEKDMHYAIQHKPHR